MDFRHADNPVPFAAMQKGRHMTAKIFTWDYSGQADLAAIAAEVARLSVGRVHMREFDTGGDNYAWIVADHLVGDDEAERLYSGEDAGDLPGKTRGQLLYEAYQQRVPEADDPWHRLLEKSRHRFEVLAEVSGYGQEEDDRPEPEGNSNDARLARWVRANVTDRAVRAEAAGTLTQPMTGGEFWDLLHQLAEHFYWLAVDDVQARYTN